MFAIMAADHTKQQTNTFTFDQLRDKREHARIIAAAKDGGCIVVDENGERRLSIWIPQEPLCSCD